MVPFLAVGSIFRLCDRIVDTTATLHRLDEGKQFIWLSSPVVSAFGIFASILAYLLLLSVIFATCVAGRII